MSSNPYTSSPGESPADLWLERSNFAGDALGHVAYGVQLAVFAECAYRISPWPRSTSPTQKNALRSWFLLSYVFVLFLLSTINMACKTKVSQQMFIDNRAYPGGPDAWYFAHFSDPLNTIGNITFILANFLADGLLLWRTYAVWNSLWVTSFPSLVYLASTAMSIMAVFQSSRPNATMWTKIAVQFSLPYFSISIALNLMLTLLLVVRLLYMSHRAKTVLGSDHGRAYVSLAAMLLESGMPYAVTGLLFIVAYACNSNLQNLVLPILSQVMCISPELIILRVPLGRAVDSMPHGPHSTIRFGAPADSDLLSVQSSGGAGRLAKAGQSESTVGSGSTARLDARPELFKGGV